MARKTVSVYNQTKETLLAGRVRVANTGLSRLIGLLGRRSLEADHGIWILPTNAIHTFGMLFRFDVILIDRSYQVVGLRERIRPFSMTWPNFRARSVLELPAGTIARSGTEAGDQLRIEPLTP
jgi:uncharacterized membrane protein (UPF0127 family)